MRKTKFLKFFPFQKIEKRARKKKKKGRKKKKRQSPIYLMNPHPAPPPSLPQFFKQCRQLKNFLLCLNKQNFFVPFEMRLRSDASLGLPARATGNNY